MPLKETRAAFRARTNTGKAFDGDARLTSDTALGWLGRHGTQSDKPWFFCLHYRHFHYPFTPPAGLTPRVEATFDAGRQLDR